MATQLERDRPAVPLKVAVRLSPVVEKRLAEIVIELSPAARRYAGVIGSLSSAMLSGLFHCTLIVVCAVVSVKRDAFRPVLQVSAAPASSEIEFEELITEKIELVVKPVDRPEFQISEPVSGNETELADFGGAPDEAFTVDLAEAPGATGLLDANLRKALLDGRGGPGVGSGRAPSPDASFSGIISQARENGLEIVVTMDSTGSMGPEIEAVKKKIVEIGGALLKKVPEARLSIVSYKDQGDEYVVKGLPLTGNLDEVQDFLKGIKAGGGGDAPEAVESGLEWAVSNNEFRPGARKAILLIGDQPPHDKDLGRCLSLAAGFHNQHEGVVSTITCRKGSPIPHFCGISRAGGGEAFLLKDSRRIMEELLVLAFGNRHRRDVVEFFDLDVPGGLVPAEAGGDIPGKPARRTR